MLLQMKMNIMFTERVNYEGIISGNLWVVIALIDLRVKEVVRRGE
jgi:hypothetical protein